MLRVLGYVEKEGRWVNKANDEGPIEPVIPCNTTPFTGNLNGDVERAVKELEQRGKSITPKAVAMDLKVDWLEYRVEILDHLHELGFEVTEQFDFESRDMIMLRW